MYVTLTSLILSAVLAMALPSRASIPPPLSSMRSALAHIQRFRAVLTSVETVTGQKQLTLDTITQALIYVRHGATVQTDTIITLTAGTQRFMSEIVNTGTRVCTRQGHRGRWSCKPRTPSQRSTASPILAHLRWTAVPDKVIQGQRCRGYSTLYYPIPQTQTVATLWMARYRTARSVASRLSAALVLRRIGPVPGHAGQDRDHRMECLE